MDRNVQEILRQWPKESRQAVQPLLVKYGAPQEMTPSLLIWYKNGPWLYTVATKWSEEHAFPMPHTNLIEQVIRCDVPLEKLSDLARFDGSITVRRTEGLLSARCHDEAANFLALNLAYDIITYAKTVEEAKRAYLQAMSDARRHKAVPYMKALHFQPQHQSGDPGTEMAMEQEVQQVAQLVGQMA